MLLHTTSDSFHIALFLLYFVIMFEKAVRFNIPPTDNTATGYSCGEVALVAAISYLLPQSEAPTREKFEQLTCKISNYNTWPEELVVALKTYPELKPTIHRTHPVTVPADSYIRHYYGANNEHIVEETNLPNLEKAIKECEARGLYEIGPFTLESLLGHVTEDSVVIGWFNCNILYEYETDTFKPHYNILTGYDLDCVSMHESGNLHSLPVAHQRVGHERFMKSLGPTPNFITLKRF